MKTSPLPTQESSEKKAITFLLPTVNRIMTLMSMDEMTSLITQLNSATDPSKSYSFSFNFKSDCFKSACDLITSASTTPRNPFLLALYFFATHPQIDLGTGALDDADKEELLELLRRYESFVNDSTNETAWDALAGFIAAENPAGAQEIIEQLSSVLPKKYVIPNNKLANVVTKDVIDIGEFVYDVSKATAKKHIKSTCILTDESDSKVRLTGRQRYTEYDRTVHDAVASLYLYGDASHIVTPAMVYRTMTGLTETEKPTDRQVKSVESSMDKMRFIRARIDCTEELQARGYTINSQQINKGEIDTYLLTADAIKVKAGGQIVKAYRIMRPPILYEYAAAVGQVLTLPASALDIKEIDSNGKVTTRSLPNTESRILIKGYLLRRIEGLKGKNSLKNPVIALYDYEKNGEIHQGLYSIAGKPDADRKEMQRIREDAEKMLAYWKATERISGYEAITTGKKITGYKISV